MCMLIVAPAGKVVPEKYLRHSLSWNKDGGGFAYISPSENKVVIEKDMYKPDEFIARYNRLIELGLNKNAMLIHMRACTAGTRDKDNAHPFPVKGGAMAHNGTFFGRGTVTGKSDTRIVAERMYNNLTKEILEANKAGFDKAFGYNRVAFLHDDGSYTIFTGNGGAEWNDGIWYSNGGYGGYGGKPSSLGSDDDNDWYGYGFYNNNRRIG